MRPNIFQARVRANLAMHGVREVSREPDFQSQSERYVLTRDDDVVSFVVTEAEILATDDMATLMSDKINQACDTGS